LLPPSLAPSLFRSLAPFAPSPPMLPRGAWVSGWGALVPPPFPPPCLPIGRHYRSAPKDFTLQMFYGQGHEFPGFSQTIYWGPTRVSRVFQTVYWLMRPIASAAASSAAFQDRWAGARMSSAMSLLAGAPGCAPTPAAAALRQQRGPGPRARLLAAALRPAHWPLGSSSGSGVLLALPARLPLGLHVALDRFTATRLTPVLKKLRCPGGPSGSAISGRF
jgi:hypothetical protein